MDHLSRIVPNLTFWFNDLILERCRSLHENYFAPRDEHSTERGGRSQGRKGTLTTLTSWGAAGRSGCGFGLWRVGTIFFVFAKYDCARPAPPGRIRRHLWPNMQRRLTFASTNNGNFCDSLIRGICVVSGTNNGFNMRFSTSCVHIGFFGYHFPFLSLKCWLCYTRQELFTSECLCKQRPSAGTCNVWDFHSGPMPHLTTI